MPAKNPRRIEIYPTQAVAAALAAKAEAAGLSKSRLACDLVEQSLFGAPTGDIRRQLADLVTELRSAVLASADWQVKAQAETRALVERALWVAAGAHVAARAAFRQQIGAEKFAPMAEALERIQQTIFDDQMTRARSAPAAKTGDKNVAIP